MMRRIGIWLSVMAFTVCAGNASAVITVGDGLFTDWFSYGGDLSHSTWVPGSVSPANSDIRRHLDVGAGNNPNGGSGGNGTYPGGGGQAYDAEEFFYTYEDANGINDDSGGLLYIGLVTGFGPDGEVSGVGSSYPTFHGGDLFIALGANLDYTYAVGLANDGGRFGRGYADSSGWDLDDPYYDGVTHSPDFTVSTPYRVNDSAGGFADISSIVSADVIDMDGNGTRWFYEVCIDLTGISGQELALRDPNNGGIGIHWTMECGNDYIRTQDNEPFAPIPEPATMVLLGMGVLGMALRAKRPQC